MILSFVAEVRNNSYINFVILEDREQEPAYNGKLNIKQKAMKLKKLFWIGVLLFPLLACEDADTSYLTEAKLVVDIPTTAYLTDFNESSNIYQFNGIGGFCLGYSDDFKNCPGDIVQIISGTGSSVSFDALKGNETIEELQLAIFYKTQAGDNYQQLQSIDLLQEGSFLNHETNSVDIDDILSPLIARLNENPRYFISIQLQGVANFNLLSSTKFSLPLVIESEFSSPRFTL